MTSLQALPNPGSALPNAPLFSAGKKFGVTSLTAGEPDRAGMIIAVSFVLITLLGMTVALGYATLFG